MSVSVPFSREKGRLHQVAGDKGHDQSRADDTICGCNNEDKNLHRVSSVKREKKKEKKINAS